MKFKVTRHLQPGSLPHDPPPLVSRGLGDTVAKVTQATGVASAVAAITQATGIPCWCLRFQGALNRAVPYV